MDNVNGQINGNGHLDGPGHVNGNGTRPRVDYAALIKPDMIHGRLYKDPAIFEDEMERLFGQNWIYVGHESEVAEPGDFVSRKLGLQPVILVRGKDKQVRLFFNRCRHRANTVCLAERGQSAGGFRCIYHGWTYATTGELVGVPYPEGFDPRDFNKADYGLAEIPMESYRGFCFGNLKPREDLKTFFGASARQVIDDAVDLAPDGELQVTKYFFKHKYQGNWKIAMDNSVDGYHGLFLHRSSFPIGRADDFDLKTIYGTEGSARVRDLGRGHACFDMSQSNADNKGFFGEMVNRGIPPEDERAYKEALARRVGPERAAMLLAHGDPGPITFFPTFNYITGEIRILQPISLFETEIHYYPVNLKGAPRSLNATRIRAESFRHGPASVISADDVFMFERAQEALKADQPEWLILKRGLGMEEQHEDGVTGLPHYETSNRSIWRHYLEVMSA